MAPVKKRVGKPMDIQTRNTERGVEMSWHRPCWGWFLTYIGFLSVSSALFAMSAPSPDYFIGGEYWWAQIMATAGVTTSLWGAFSSLSNRHRVIVNKHQLIRVTRPVRLFDRYVAFDRSHIHSFYLDDRQGIIFTDYQVLVLMSNKRAESLFVTEDMTIAWYLQQALCGLMRSENKGKLDYTLRRRPDDGGGMGTMV